jgi:hypothetical protein
VVSGKHQHRRFWVAASRKRSRDRDCRPGIPTGRLEHDVGLGTELTQLLGHDEAEVRIGDDHRPRKQGWIGDPLQRLLESRSSADQVHELLGHAFARDRPQARSRAPAHEDRYQQSRIHPESFDASASSTLSQTIWLPALGVAITKTFIDG